MQTWTQWKKEISKDPWEAKEERQSKGQRFMDINAAEEKEIDQKWCKEGEKKWNPSRFIPEWSWEMQGGLSKPLCTGLAFLFISVLMLLPISTLRLVVNSLGAPHRECATQIKMRVQNWRNKGWRKEKIRGRTESCCFKRHVSLCDFTCSVTCC